MACLFNIALCLTGVPIHRTLIQALRCKDPQLKTLATAWPWVPTAVCGEYLRRYDLSSDDCQENCGEGGGNRKSPPLAIHNGGRAGPYRTVTRTVCTPWGVTSCLQNGRRFSTETRTTALPYGQCLPRTSYRYMFVLANCWI